MLGDRISQLESKLGRTSPRNTGSLPGWAEVDAVMRQKEALEEQLIELTAQLKISQRR